MGVSERRQREREERRERIIDAAEEVFFERGVDAATMDEVAQRVELSKGALYLYFKGKDELFTAVMNRCHAALVDDLESLSGDAEDGLSLVASVAGAYLRFMEQYPAHTRLLTSAMASGRCIPPHVSNYAEHRELTQRELRAVMGAVERGKRDGSVREDVDPGQLAVHLWGGLMGMMTLSLQSEQMQGLPLPSDVTATFPSFIRLVLRGIAAHPTT